MSTTTQSSPRAFAFIESRQLGFAWVLSVLLGALMISSNPSSNPQRLVIPVLIMLLYGVFVYNRWAGLFASASKAYQLNIVGQLADSMYFMGFVWTLWALIDSFVIHQIDTGEAIFRTFGYALVTTAVGMFCRLAILQFKYTSAEQSESAQASVEEVLLKFSVTLQSTIIELNAWNVNLTTGTKGISEANESLVAATQKAREELVQTFKTATDSYVGMLNTAHHRLEKDIHETANILKLALQNGIAEGLQNFGKVTASNLDQIRASTAGLAATLKRTDTGLSKSVTDLTEKVLATSKAVQDTAGIVSAVPRALRSTVDTITNDLEAADKRLTSSVEISAAALQLASATLTGTMAGLSTEIKNELKLGLDGISISPQVSLAIDDSAVESAVTRALASTQQSVTHLNTKVESIMRDLSESGRRLDLFESTTKTNYASLSGRLELLHKDVSSIHSRVDQISPRRPIFGPFFGGQPKEGN